MMRLSPDPLRRTLPWAVRPPRYPQSSFGARSGGAGPDGGAAARSPEAGTGPGPDPAPPALPRPLSPLLAAAVSFTS